MDKEEIKGAAFVWILVFSACMFSSFGALWLFGHNIPVPAIDNPVSAYVVRDEPYIIPDPCGLDVVLCPGETGYETAMLKEKIRSAAMSAGIDPAVALAIAQCESTLNPSAINAKSGATGLYQFLASTWIDIGSPGDRLNVDDSIAAFVAQYPIHPGKWAECE